MASVPDHVRARGVHAVHLKDATARLHRQVETRMDVRRMFASTGAYRAALGVLLGFHRPLEPLLTAAGAALTPSLPPVPRARRLTADLIALGGDPAAFRDCADLPALDDEAHTVGVLYVVEGSALGGAVLARLARRRLDLGAATGAGFFTGDDGPHAAARWSTVLTHVEALGADGRLDAVVAGATDAFTRLDDWFQAAQPFGGSVRA